MIGGSIISTVFKNSKANHQYGTKNPKMTARSSATTKAILTLRKIIDANSQNSTILDDWSSVR